MTDITSLAPMLPFLVALLAYFWVIRRPIDPMDGRAERRRDRFC
jgi:hypothetical protein